MTTVETTPFHLAGNFRPVVAERTEVDLPVRGELPAELGGLFVRNGPNPVSTSPHWFLGEGMVHGVRLEGGRALWYRNRMVRTASLADDEAFVNERGERNYVASKANTHVIRHAGRIFALAESSFPYELTENLDTLGWCDFDGRLTSAMTAHPKICPTTGESALLRVRSPTPVRHVLRG